MRSQLLYTHKQIGDQFNLVLILKKLCDVSVVGLSPLSRHQIDWDHAQGLLDLWRQKAIEEVVAAVVWKLKKGVYLASRLQV